jgi:tetratricopeptide (TPR) repeat protein
VFAGGWTIEAAEAACDPAGDLGLEVLAGLSSLIDNSLIRQTEAGPEETRFGMLETIREYAAEELAAQGEADSTAERHARYFLALGEEAEPHLEAEDPAVWLDRIEREHDNFRAALRWALDGDETEMAQRFGAALWRFWYQRGYLREGANWLDEALALPGPRDAVRAGAHTAAGGIAYWRTDYDHVGPHYEETLAISQELGDRRGEMEAFYNLGFVHVVRGDYAAATRLWEQSVAVAGELDDRAAVARGRFSIGMGMMMTDPVAALPLLKEARAFWQEVGNAPRFAESTGAVGWGYRRAGSLDEAERYYKEALGTFRETGNLPLTAAILDSFAAIASERALHGRAMRLTGAARALKELIGGRMPVAAMIEEDLEPAARAGIGDDAAEAALAEGRTMTVEQAAAYALSDDA